jgi:hypothetical protein
VYTSHILNGMVCQSVASVGLIRYELDASNVTRRVHKPNPQSFVRVHPDEAFRLQTAVLEAKLERETYLVDSAPWDDLAHELVPKMLFTAMDRQQNLFLWPVRLPRETQICVRLRLELAYQR